VLFRSAGTWTNQTVTVHYTCADTGGSGLASCTADQVFSATGVTTSTSGSATDNAGNSATASFGPIQIDKVAPTIAFTPSNGSSVGPTLWSTECATPGICGTVTDAHSGVASVGPATVRRLSDGRYWNGSAFQVAAVNAPLTFSITGVPASASWSIALPSARLNNGLSYTVTMHATDVAGNATTSSATFTYDSTKPTPVSVATSNGDGAVGAGDTFAVTFSEPIDPASATGSQTLTMSRTGSTVTKYDITGLMSGALTTGSTGYVTAGGGTRNVTYNGTLSVSGSVVTFTVTSGCVTGCAFATAGAPAGSFQYKAATTITDLAGNTPTTGGLTTGPVVLF
jgi:hypothetical protein